jgi:hypothetical protein
MLDGADNDEADETEDRCGAEGEDRLAGAAGAGDGGKRAFSEAASSPVFGFGANQAVAIG